MIELEVFGEERLEDPLLHTHLHRVCVLALASAGVEDGHIAVEFVSPERIAELNERHRAKRGPTDVLSFPIDGVDVGPGRSAVDAGGGATSGAAPPRELGDIVICPEHTEDVLEAVVHGALHLVGMDHETDDGEMLALQAELLRWSEA